MGNLTNEQVWELLNKEKLTEEEKSYSRNHQQLYT